MPQPASPESWVEPAEVAETHISVLFFAGDRAYKLKRPVDLGFVDLTSREARERTCRREVELNRRLAPDVYLGVLDLVQDGSLVDHLVVMRRMPRSRRLSFLVSEGDQRVREHVRAVARAVAAFHARAERSPEIDAAATAAAVKALWDESFEAMHEFEGEVLDPDACRRIEHLVGRYIEGRGELFDRRIAGGHVVDGHGDLQAADIFCLEDGPRILDCIEFNDRFRHGDVIADIAFLAMDLERLGAAELARELLNCYAEFAAETCPRSLVEHYVAYRAHVRCKVNCLRSSQASGVDREEAIEEARRLLHTTLRWLEAARIRLVLVGGAPGTGKSTVAAALGDRLGWPVLATDEIRLEGEQGSAPGVFGYGEGRYAPEIKDRVYRELLDRAFRALRNGESVVLDATWAEHRHREEARAVGAECSADLLEMRCAAPDEVAVARIREREGGPSEVTPEIAARIASEADAWPEAAVIDTSGSPADSIAAALDAISPSAEQA